MKFTLITGLIGVIIVSMLLLAGCSGKADEKPDTSVTGAAISEAEAQVVEIGVNRYGYQPSEIIVKGDWPVTLRNDGSLKGCAVYPVQPELGLYANFANSNEYTFFPKKKGTFTYSCSMGMISGLITVT